MVSEQDWSHTSLSLMREFIAPLAMHDNMSTLACEYQKHVVFTNIGIEVGKLARTMPDHYKNLQRGCRMSYNAIIRPFFEGLVVWVKMDENPDSD